ncbi:MAG: ABC transporter substrate-binding protein [Microthrixaceae bacterium]|nr:ABC transporter substrate-binding protein [Microthrixaceae bacterium]
MVERDAKLSEYKQRITEACAEDFMLVGGGGVFDDTGQVERVSCLLPEIPAYQVSPQSRDSDLIVNPLPRGLDSLDIGGLNYLDETFPDSTDSVGFLTGTIPSTVFIDAQLQEGAEALGWEKVYEAQYNPAGESSWTPFAQAIKSAGVRGLVYSGEPENLAALQQALADIDYELDWTLAGNNALDAGFIEIGGDAVSNVFISPNMVPPFMASENPATQQYLDLFDEYLPDGKSEAGLGYNAFSAWLLFATAVKECGSEVTRSCVWDAASSITEWTGGGLHGQTNPGEGIPSTCVIIVEGTPDGFVVPEDFEPNEGLYDCSEDNVIDLEADYGEGVSLESVGKSLDDLQ